MGRARRAGRLLAASLLFVAGAAASQTPPPATLTQPPPAGTAPSGPPPAAAASPARPTLVPKPGDPVSMDEVTLPAKPAAILSGQSSWDEGLKTIRAAIGKVEAELGKAGIAPAGRPLAVFTQTSDDTFRFDVMVPIASAPQPAPALPADMRFGTTPSGKAYRFVHNGPYDDIDATYETITAYLDSKDIVASDTFIEEYLNDVSDPADGALEANIFVQPR